MAIDFSYLEGADSQKENTPTQTDTANVTIRVDADCLLLCDGDFIDQPFKAGALIKIQLPIGQHLLEFLYAENPDVKVEKVVDFDEAGKSYLVIVNELKAAVAEAADACFIPEGVEEIKKVQVPELSEELFAASYNCLYLLTAVSNDLVSPVARYAIVFYSYAFFDLNYD